MSLGQPSPQGIASLYRGHPEVLDARIKQEQQAKPGMPPDMAKLLALQIDTNETDAVKRQKALAALQGMQQQTPTGTPPTVAEIVAQQARQKAEQEQMAAAQQSGGLQALLGQAGPAPERQGSIDELPSNLGDTFAGGGIVAFKTGDEVEDSEVTDEDKPKLRQVTQRELAEEYNRKRWAQQAEDEKRTSMAGDVGRALKSAAEGVYNPLAAAWNNLSERQKIRQQMEQNRPGLFEGLTDEERAARQAKGQGLVGQLNKLVEGEATPATAPADIRTQLNTAEAKMRPVAPAAPVRDLAALAAQKQRAQNAATTGTTNTPAASAAPATPAAMSDYEKYLKETLNRDPATIRREALARRKAEIGDVDTSAQEAYIKSLQGQIGGLEEPTDVYDRARAHLRRLATAGGRNWMQTGANASAAWQGERQAAEQKKMDLLKEIMGESTKVADLKRSEKEKAFTFAEKEYDETYKRAYEAAKEMGLDERQRQLFAHQTAEKVLDRANQIKVAQIGADARGGGAADKQQLAELKALQASKTTQLKNAYGSDKKRLQGELAAIEAEIAKMAGLSTMSTAPGAGSPGGTRPPLSSFQR